MFQPSYGVRKRPPLNLPEVPCIRSARWSDAGNRRSESSERRNAEMLRVPLDVAPKLRLGNVRGHTLLGMLVRKFLYTTAYVCPNAIYLTV